MHGDKELLRDMRLLGNEQKQSFVSNTVHRSVSSAGYWILTFSFFQLIHRVRLVLLPAVIG